MVTDDENKENNIDEISSLLKKYYKPDQELNEEKFWNELSKKIESLFHKELYSEKIIDENGKLISEEERYWLGLSEYIGNKVNSLKHKEITSHLLSCSECRKNHNRLLDEKKTPIDELYFMPMKV